MFGHSANRYGSKPVKLAHSHCSYPQTAVTLDEATEQVLSTEIKPQMSLKWLVKPDHTSSANVARLHWRQQHPSVCMHGLLTGSGALPSTITSSISGLRRPGWVARKAVAQKAVATDEPLDQAAGRDSHHSRGHNANHNEQPYIPSVLSRRVFPTWSM